MVQKYLTNKSLLAQIEISTKQDRMTEDFGKMIVLLVDRYGQKARFLVTESFKDDMKQFAVMTVCKVWRGFDTNKSQNPFAYFTQIIHHAFFQYQNQERRQRNIRDSLMVNTGQTPSNAFMSEYEHGQQKENELYSKHMNAPVKIIKESPRPVPEDDNDGAE